MYSSSGARRWSWAADQTRWRLNVDRRPVACLLGGTWCWCHFSCCFLYYFTQCIFTSLYSLFQIFYSFIYSISFSPSYSLKGANKKLSNCCVNFRQGNNITSPLSILLLLSLTPPPPLIVGSYKRPPSP